MCVCMHVCVCMCACMGVCDEVSIFLCFCKRFGHLQDWVP